MDFLPVVERHASNGIELNLVEVYANITMDVIATCAFATKINSNKNKDDAFVKNARIITKPSLFRITAMQLLPEFLLNLLKIRSIFEEGSSKFFFNMTRHILRERKSKTNENFDDFVQLLMNAEKNLKDVHDDNDLAESHYDITGKLNILNL